MLAAITSAGAGCGLFADDGDGSSSAAVASSAPADDLSAAERALCEVGDVLRLVGDSSIEEVLTGDDPDVAGPLVAVGLFVGVRDEVVGELGPYEVGALAVGRRYEQYLVRSEEARPDSDVALPDAEPTGAELRSVQAADAFLAEGRCPADEDG